MRRDEIGRLLGGWHAVAGPRGVIDAVIGAFAKRIATHGPLGVIGHVIDIGRKERLIALVDSRAALAHHRNDCASGVRL